VPNSTTTTNMQHIPIQYLHLPSMIKHLDIKVEGKVQGVGLQGKQPKPWPISSVLKAP
jgi:hypothetical protein